MLLKYKDGNDYVVKEFTSLRYNEGRFGYASNACFYTNSNIVLKIYWITKAQYNTLVNILWSEGKLDLTQYNLKYEETNN